MRRIFDITARQEFQGLVDNAFDHLKKSHQANNREDFNSQLEKVLLGVRRYITHRLSAAIANGYVPSGQFKVDDFVSDLYLVAYDKFHEVQNIKDLRGWLIKKTDELLEDTITDEEFDNYFFENIDNYTQQEWDAMDEKFSTDGDGDLVMEEELDDSSYPKYNYTLKDAFIEDHEDELIEKLNKELSEEEIHRHIDMVVHKLPIRMRTVFNLAVNHHFTPDEIAEIQSISEQEAIRHLIDARSAIRISFENKYSITQNC